MIGTQVIIIYYFLQVSETEKMSGTEFLQQTQTSRPTHKAKHEKKTGEVTKVTSPAIQVLSISSGRSRSLFAGFDRGLSGCQAGDWDSPWGAADVVQTDFVAEVDGLWIATVFAADADLQI